MLASRIHSAGRVKSSRVHPDATVFGFVIVTKETHYSLSVLISKVVKTTLGTVG